MPAVLTPSVVALVRRLLARPNATQRAVARQAGISRGSVHSIARGKRGLHLDQPQTARQNGNADLAELASSEDYERCPEHGLVLMPCVICAALAAPGREPSGQHDPDDAGAISLRGEARERYEEIHRRKESESYP